MKFSSSVILSAFASQLFFGSTDAAFATGITALDGTNIAKYAVFPENYENAAGENPYARGPSDNGIIGAVKTGFSADLGSRSLNSGSPTTQAPVTSGAGSKLGPVFSAYAGVDTQYTQADISLAAAPGNTYATVSKLLVSAVVIKDGLYNICYGAGTANLKNKNSGDSYLPLTSNILLTGAEKGGEPGVFLTGTKKLPTNVVKHDTGAGDLLTGMLPPLRPRDTIVTSTGTGMGQTFLNGANSGIKTQIGSANENSNAINAADGGFIAALGPNYTGRDLDNESGGEYGVGACSWRFIEANTLLYGGLFATNRGAFKTSAADEYFFGVATFISFAAVVVPPEGGAETPLRLAGETFITYQLSADGTESATVMSAFNARATAETSYTCAWDSKALAATLTYTSSAPASAGCVVILFPTQKALVKRPGSSTARKALGQAYVAAPVVETATDAASFTSASPEQNTAQEVCETTYLPSAKMSVGQYYCEKNSATEITANLESSADYAFGGTWFSTASGKSAVQAGGLFMIAELQPTAPAANGKIPDLYAEISPLAPLLGQISLPATVSAAVDKEVVFQIPTEVPADAFRLSQYSAGTTTGTGQSGCKIDMAFGTNSMSTVFASSPFLNQYSYGGNAGLHNALVVGGEQSDKITFTGASLTNTIGHGDMTTTTLGPFIGGAASSLKTGADGQLACTYAISGPLGVPGVVSVKWSSDASPANFQATAIRLDSVFVGNLLTTRGFIDANGAPQPELYTNLGTSATNFNQTALQVNGGANVIAPQEATTFESNKYGNTYAKNYLFKWDSGADSKPVATVLNAAVGGSIVAGAKQDAPGSFAMLTVAYATRVAIGTTPARDADFSSTVFTGVITFKAKSFKVNATNTPQFFSPADTATKGDTFLPRNVHFERGAGASALQPLDALATLIGQNNGSDSGTNDTIAANADGWTSSTASPVAYAGKAILTDSSATKAVAEYRMDFSGIVSRDIFTNLSAGKGVLDYIDGAKTIKIDGLDGKTVYNAMYLPYAVELASNATKGQVTASLEPMSWRHGVKCGTAVPIAKGATEKACEVKAGNSTTFADATTAALEAKTAVELSSESDAFKSFRSTASSGANFASLNATADFAIRMSRNGTGYPTYDVPYPMLRVEFEKPATTDTNTGVFAALQAKVSRNGAASLVLAAACGVAALLAALL